VVIGDFHFRLSLIKAGRYRVVSELFALRTVRISPISLESKKHHKSCRIIKNLNLY
jgi:hypothetical protein